MKEKTVWLILTCLIVVSLLLASCGPAVTEEEEAVVPPVTEQEVVTEEEEAVQPEEEEEAPPTPLVLENEMEGESQAIALDYLLSSSTFKFDGMEDTVRLVSRAAQEKPYYWQFDYEFQSRHAGYGDRTGLILAQVITDHRAQIVVEQGKVTYAVLDGKWDVLRQRIIE